MTNEVCEASEYDGDPNNRFAQLRPPLLAAALAQAGDRHFAEDAVQIAMERVFKKFPDLEEWSPGRLKAYSRTVLKNVLRDEYRRMGRQKAIPTAPEDLPRAALQPGSSGSCLRRSALRDPPLRYGAPEAPEGSSYPLHT